MLMRNPFRAGALVRSAALRDVILLSAKNGVDAEKKVWYSNNRFREPTFPATMFSRGRAAQQACCQRAIGC